MPHCAGQASWMAGKLHHREQTIPGNATTTSSGMIILFRNGQIGQQTRQKVIKLCIYSGCDPATSTRQNNLLPAGTRFNLDDY